ncbi:hypothetical protein R3P38DRAFT_2815091 [Favolaschia claudopus]|uniref:Uncharacterized protein n=1 Tax=Favolaschia claudopus TaxID=2862362 RepID=A0AAV9Z1Y0_9AGAR
MGVDEDGAGLGGGGDVAWRQMEQHQNKKRTRKKLMLLRFRAEWETTRERQRRQVLDGNGRRVSIQTCVGELELTGVWAGQKELAAAVVGCKSRLERDRVTTLRKKSRGQNKPRSAILQRRGCPTKDGDVGLAESCFLQALKLPTPSLPPIQHVRSAELRAVIGGVMPDYLELGLICVDTGWVQDRYEPRKQVSRSTSFVCAGGRKFKVADSPKRKGKERDQRDLVKMDELAAHAIAKQRQTYASDEN